MNIIPLKCSYRLIIGSHDIMLSRRDLDQLARLSAETLSSCPPPKLDARTALAGYQPYRRQYSMQSILSLPIGGTISLCDLSLNLILSIQASLTRYKRQGRGAWSTHRTRPGCMQVTRMA